MEVTVEASYAGGGSKGDAPGTDMILGTVKRYKYDDTKTPARMTIECKGH